MASTPPQSPGPLPRKIGQDDDGKPLNFVPPGIEEATRSKKAPSRDHMSEVYSDDAMNDMFLEAFECVKLMRQLRRRSDAFSNAVDSAGGSCLQICFVFQLSWQCVVTLRFLSS